MQSASATAISRNIGVLPVVKQVGGCIACVIMPWRTSEVQHRAYGGDEQLRFGPRLRERGRVRPLLAPLHGGELVAQRCDAALAEPGGDRGHERMRHSGARAVRQHPAGARARRGVEEGGDADVAVGDEKGLWV
jgi:hypothetical protein